MLHRLNVIARALRRNLARRLRPAGDAAPPFSAEATFDRMASAKRTLFFVGSAAIAGWLLYAHMPV